jgi:hypothetical protein
VANDGVDNAPIAAEPTPPHGLRHIASRAIDWILPEKNPTGAVYGTMIVGAVLATESAGRETLVETVTAVALALGLYWLAHAYAATLGQRLDNQTPLSTAALRRALVRDFAIVRGAIAPILALLIAAAAGASLATAVLAAVWTSAVLIVTFEVVAATRAQMRGRELIVQVCVGAIMGLAIIALRVVMHWH